jgi:hypothetical protein
VTCDGIHFTAVVVIITAAVIEWTRATLALTLGRIPTPAAVISSPSAVPWFTADDLRRRAAVQEIEADGRINLDVPRDMPSAVMSRRFDAHRVALDLQGMPAGLICCRADGRRAPPDGTSCKAGAIGRTPDVTGFTADVIEMPADLMEIPADGMVIPAEVTCFTADRAEITSEVNVLTADAPHRTVTLLDTRFRPRKIRFGYRGIRLGRAD